MQWGSFAEETVRAMFALRTHRPFNTVDTRRLEHAPDLEQFSELVLSVPRLIAHLAGRARDALACHDLPERSRTPIVTLFPSSRARLQYDCIHRRFLHTSIGQEDATLLHMTVQHCVTSGLAPMLLLDPLSSVIRDISLNVWCSAQITDNPLHRFLHGERGVGRHRRVRSLNDLVSLDDPCDCLASTADQRAGQEEIVRGMAEIRLCDHGESGSDSGSSEASQDCKEEEDDDDYV
jgi:hypothetical protein